GGLDRIDVADAQRAIAEHGLPLVLCTAEIMRQLRIRKLAIDRCRRHADDQTPAMHQRDLRREERVLTNECLRAVDRIHEPEVFGIERALPGFFAVEPMIGETLADHLANRLLALD